MRAARTHMSSVFGFHSSGLLDRSFQSSGGDKTNITVEPQPPGFSSALVLARHTGSLRVALTKRIGRFGVDDGVDGQ